MNKSADLEYRYLFLLFIVDNQNCDTNFVIRLLCSRLLFVKKINHIKYGKLA